MNVEIDHIERKISLVILPHHFFNDGLRIITVAALLHAQRPERRQRHVPGEISIPVEYLFDRRPIEKVIVHLTAFGAEPNPFLRQPAKIEIAAITIVKKDSVSGRYLCAFAHRVCQRNSWGNIGFVNNTGTFKTSTYLGCNIIGNINISLRENFCRWTTCVGHQNIDASEPLHPGLDQARHVIGFGNIGRQCEHFGAGCFSYAVYSECWNKWRARPRSAPTT